MSPSRRDFLKTGAAAAAVLAGPRILAANGSPLPEAGAAPLIATPTAEPYVLELSAEALGAARALLQGALPRFDPPAVRRPS